MVFLYQIIFYQLNFNFQVAAPARAGALAPVDVSIPAQVTNLGPEKTSFFQALQIPTKITRGTIEIIVRRYKKIDPFNLITKMHSSF